MTTYCKSIVNRTDTQILYLRIDTILDLFADQLRFMYGVHVLKQTYTQSPVVIDNYFKTFDFPNVTDCLSSRVTSSFIQT